MPDLPAPVTPLFVGTNSRYFASATLRLCAPTLGVITWVANQAIYMPVAIPWHYPVKRVFWYNGSTVTTTNVDFGIYTPGGGRVYSTGSTAMGTASEIQYVSVATPFILAPGAYYFAWTCSNTTARANGWTITNQQQMQMLGCLTQATALPLPNPATFASYGATPLGIPMCGITRTASGF